MDAAAYLRPLAGFVLFAILYLLTCLQGLRAALIFPEDRHAAAREAVVTAGIWLFSQLCYVVFRNSGTPLMLQLFAHIPLDALMWGELVLVTTLAYDAHTHRKPA